MKWVVVTPTNRVEKYLQFLDKWEQLFINHGVHLVVVEDAPKKSKEITKRLNIPHTHLCWDDLPEFIPRQSDMIRSHGMYVGSLLKPEWMMTLDDDTEPSGRDPFIEYAVQFLKGAPFSNYFSVGSITTSQLEMRGFPYGHRKPSTVAVQYGGWHGVMDYDAATQLASPEEIQAFEQVSIPIPRGVGATCCIMNTAWKREYTPIMWQLPLYQGNYNRFGDIWSGLFIKKTLDAVGSVMVINGKASVRHDRASNPFANIRREAPGMEMNESLWDNLATPDTDNLIKAYTEVTDSAANYISEFDESYAKYFIKCRDEWLKLYA